MDRRGLLAAGGAITVTGLTGTPARAAVRRPVFEWVRPGGFFSPGEGILTPPPLAVFDDNTAYADAAAGLRLRPRQVEALRAHAAEVLSDARTTARDPGKPAHDRPVDLVSVRADDATYLTAALESWDEGDAVGGLARHVQDLRRTVLDGGEPWRPNAILLATIRLDDEPATSEPWPTGLPRPDTGTRYAEQFPRGRPAQIARQALQSGRRVWPAYRVSPVDFVRATWRHLLPHEL